MEGLWKNWRDGTWKWPRREARTGAGSGGDGKWWCLIAKASGREQMRVRKNIKDVTVTMKVMEAILSFAIGFCLSFLSNSCYLHVFIGKYYHTHNAYIHQK